MMQYLSLVYCHCIQQSYILCACSVTSVLSDSATLWMAAHQDPLSMGGFSRQEYWSGLPYPPPGVHLPDLEIELGSPACRQILYRWATEEAHLTSYSGVRLQSQWARTQEVIVPKISQNFLRRWQFKINNCSPEINSTLFQHNRKTSSAAPPPRRVALKGRTLLYVLWVLVVSDSLRSHELEPARLLCPWDSPGKNTGVGSHSLLRVSSWPRGGTWGFCTADRFCLSHQGSPLAWRNVHSVRVTEAQQDNSSCPITHSLQSEWQLSRRRGTAPPI